MQAQRRRLPPAATVLLPAAAVVAPLDAGWAIAVAGLDDLDAIRACTELCAAGVVTPGTDHLLPVQGFEVQVAITSDDLDTARRATREVAQLPSHAPRNRAEVVAAHLSGGLTYRDIGAQLFIAPKNVEHHVARIRRKLGAGSRAELLVALWGHVPALPSRRSSSASRS